MSVYLQYVQLNVGLLLQASTPSVHVWPTFALPMPPQVLNQAPPGAQQLVLPDFKNVPHFEHVIILAIIEVGVEVLTDVVIGVRTISSRPGIGRPGRRDTYSGTDRRVMRRYDCGGRVSHTIFEIDPGEPTNMSSLFAPE